PMDRNEENYSSSTRYEAVQELISELTQHLKTLDDRKVDLTIRASRLVLKDPKSQEHHQVRRELNDIDEQRTEMQAQLEELKQCAEVTSSAPHKSDPPMEATSSKQVEISSVELSEIPEWQPHIRQCNEDNKDQIRVPRDLPKYATNKEDCDDIETFLDKFQTELYSHCLDP
ncbi:hypothetical protein EC988_008770, partial [Linderina pennispora]